MPPYGLYPVPQHHLYSNSPPEKRPVFNSMDFLELQEEPASKEKLETAEERARRKQEKRERKEKKRQEKELRKAEAAAKADTAKEMPPESDLTPMVPAKSGRYGQRGPYKKREKGPDGKPVSATKRKRESDANAPKANDTGLNNDTSLLNPNFLTGLKESMGDLGAVFNEPKVVESSSEPPRKKRGRPPGSRKSVTAESTTTGTPKPSKSPAKVVPPDEGKTKTQRTEKSEDTSSTVDKPFKMIRTPVPVPSVASTLLSGPKKTPIPLPQKTSGSMSEPPLDKRTNLLRESQVLVSETPPSQMRLTPVTMPHQPAIPFSLSQATPSSTQTVKTKKGPTINVSSSDEPASTPEELGKAKHFIGSQGSVNPLTSSQVDNFTSSNLMRYKQKLNDEPKPRPRSRRAVSEATSTTSSTSSTSMSIRDMLTRIPKPYTSPATEKNPFVIDASEKKAKKEKKIETHDEADYNTFTTAYKASQHTINFTDEAEYLNEHIALLAASAAAGPLPCLHKATGCSPKSEQMLRLHREDNTTALKMVVTSESDAALSATHISRAQAADTLLRHSIAARIPVALGPIDGTWKLYCPDYTSLHVDKYGFGLRTLSIHSVAGLFKPKTGTEDDGPMYTARLYIPPRSMAFTLAEFIPPPHASFRGTTLKTVAEGYKMDIVFLGNGYLKLRVDVHLLLMGKASAESGGGGGGLGGRGTGGKGKAKAKEFGIWEFLGVHEKAVIWQPAVDELEVEGKKLCAKYDG